MWNRLFLLSLFVCAAFGADIEEDENVLVLTDDNFDEAIAENDLLLVEFYAPWCGHCKSLAPEYAKAATALLENDPPIRIAKVDATAATKVAEKYKIQGFPTLKLFKGSVDPSDIKDYDGGRTSDDIQKWMIKKSGPAVAFVSKQEELDKLTDSNEVVVIAYLESEDGEHRQTLEKIAGLDDNAVYVATTDADLMKAHDKKSPAVTLLKKFDDGNVDFDGEFDQEAITTFIKGNSVPLIMTFSQEKASQIFGGDIDIHLLMFADESADYFKDFSEKTRKAATAHKGKMLHIIIPLSEDRILDYFGFKEADLPAVMLVNMAGGMKKFGYPLKGDELIASLTSDYEAEILKFEESYFNGDLKPSLKSADPVDDSDEAVKVIVGKTFKERVVDSDQDVLLEFYAPWCGHCKNLAPKYEELAEKFAGVESIMIAKMDATENEVDHPGVDVQGFPTILFFPAGKEEPITYDGDRDVKGFTEFLKEKARKFELDGESHGITHDEL